MEEKLYTPLTTEEELRRTIADLQAALKAAEEENASLREGKTKGDSSGFSFYEELFMQSPAGQEMTLTPPTEEEMQLADCAEARRAAYRVIVDSDPELREAEDGPMEDSWDDPAWRREYRRRGYEKRTFGERVRAWFSSLLPRRRHPLDYDEEYVDNAA